MIARRVDNLVGGTISADTINTNSTFSASCAVTGAIVGNVTLTWKILNNQVYLKVPTTLYTASAAATSRIIIALPSTILPLSAQDVVIHVIDNGNIRPGIAVITTSTLDIYTTTVLGVRSTFTIAQSAGVNDVQLVEYTLW
jgi:hypothetical protein